MLNFSECVECVDDETDYDVEYNLCDDFFTLGVSSWRKNTNLFSRKIRRGSAKQCRHPMGGRRSCPQCCGSKHRGKSLNHTNKFISFDKLHETTLTPKRNEIIKKNIMKPVLCTICYDTVCGKDRTSRRCGHVFHESCMKIWARECRPQPVSCPLCRKF